MGIEQQVHHRIPRINFLWIFTNIKIYEYITILKCTGAAVGYHCNLFVFEILCVLLRVENCGDNMAHLMGMNDLFIIDDVSTYLQYKSSNSREHLHSTLEILSL
jgi:hypothetical protein